MFGSKLRSWMETHIVRPRKRNNKNKQNHGNVDSTKSEVSHLHNNSLQTNGGISLTLNGNVGANHCCGNGVISSPVRRREVSPIQNQSRFGWQSPDTETITSPKSDNFLYAPKHHRFGRETTHRHQFDTKNDLTAPLSEPKNPTHSTHSQPQLNPENSSSSFSSLSWSTGSKEQNSITVEKQNGIGERSMNLQVPTITYQCTNEENHLDEDVDAVHYEEIQATILRHPDNMTNRNYIYQERPKSEQLSTFAPLQRQTEFSDRRSVDDASSVRYGKLLPSRLQWKCSDSNESINRSQFHATGSAECLPSQNLPNRCSTNSQRYRLRKGGLSNQYPPGVKQPPANITNGNAIPLNSLSSPESAYSTGYSTDGTSPGTCYNHAPEYYINMRTGTHYFPKSMNSLAIETQRCKFGLNKIEEMSPIDPLPKMSFATACSKTSKPNIYACPGSPNTSFQAVEMRNATVQPTLRGYESSSPRQRCRIRTNPWVSTHDSMTSSGVTFQQLSQTSAASSRTCSSRSSTSVSMQIDGYISPDGMGQQLLSENKRKYVFESSNNSVTEIYKHNDKAMYDSSSSLDTEDTKQYTVSLTEVDSRPRASTPSTLTHVKRLEKGESSAIVISTHTVAVHPVVAYLDAASEEDATLNEMMGKFDESYVYEKETDILSDSDATNCPSEHFDAGDECDTDDLLEIDFIDTTSMHEMSEKKENYQGKALQEKSFEWKQSSSNSNRRFQDPSNDNSRNRQSGSGSGSQRRRKRLIKTRKKSISEQKENINVISPRRKSRETRSVGGTPISLRRNSKASKERNCKKTSLSERSSSLVFPNDQKRRYMTVAESNRALLKADLEADFKYRQLIQEAESILISLKSSTQSLPRETPVSSPRRLNPLMNKRVEMLKINEIKQQPPQPNLQHPSTQPQSFRSTDMEPDFTAVCNKRIELLKHETTSAPNSPRSVQRFSPSKTHITNFINQIDGSRKIPITSNEHQLTNCVTQNHNRSPSKISTVHRRSSVKGDVNHSSSEQENGPKVVTKYSNSDYKMDVANHNCIPNDRRNTYEDYTNHNVAEFEFKINGNRLTTIGKHYCPQSEPLKRKVYKDGSSFDRIKCSFNIELERTNQTLLNGFDETNYSHRHMGNITNLRSLTPNTSTQDINLNSPLLVNRKQLLLDTLADLKQNLESQSVELNGLNLD